MTAQLEPWVHRESGWSAATAAQTESLLALSNGYLGLRGTLDEGEPTAAPGTFLNGFHETRPISHADRGYGDPELEQVLVNVTDGTRIRLVVDGEPLDVRTGTVLERERVLDLRAGMLLRTLRWRSARGHEIRLHSRRLVSLVHRELAAIEYEVEATEGPVPVTVQSELAASGREARGSFDPRSGAALPADILVPRLAACHRQRAVLAHQTRASGHVVAAGMDHVMTSPAARDADCEAAESLARWSLTSTAEPGHPVRLVKLLAYHWAVDGDPETLAGAVRGSLDQARELGFEQLARQQRAVLDEVWERADIELEGDDEVQHALRFALFHVHQNAACAAGHAIPAKGLTGSGYNGHTFWDTEIFLLPMLTFCAPHLVRDALLWRASTLPKARARARELGLQGAAFPWRTIAGEECAAYLPAGTAAFHVNADVAHAATSYVEATGDHEFERKAGAALLVETARMWASLGYHDERRGGRFSIDGVTGPDEYSALVDNNLYTNLMAQANLRAAAHVVERHGAEALDVGPEEVVAWRRAADSMTILYDPELEVHLQDEDFARHAPFEFVATRPDQYPLLLHVPYFELYRRQVIKQPDLVLAMSLRGEAFTPAEKLRNFLHYEALTVRDSSLAPGTQAVVAAEVGHVELAYDYLAEAALLDHGDFMRNTGDGLHLAALAGGWLAVIAGLAGLRHRDGLLSFAPRLPQRLHRIAFPITFRHSRLHVVVTSASATYRLLSGASIEIEHWDERLKVTRREPASGIIPAPPPVPSARQPPGRGPLRRVAGPQRAPEAARNRPQSSETPPSVGAADA